MLLSFVNIGHFGQAMYVDNIMISPSINTGINDISLPSVRIFPVPFKDQFNLMVDADQEYEFILYDALGHAVIRRAAKGESHFIDLNISPGYYTYSLEFSNGQVKRGSLIKAE